MKALSNHRPSRVNSGKIFHAGGCKFIDAFKTLRQNLRRPGAYMTNAKGSDNPRHSPAPAGVNRVDYILRALGATLYPRYVKQRKLVKISDVHNKSAGDKKIDHGGSDTVDVHLIPADKMFQPLTNLCGTIGIDAPNVHPAGVLFGWFITGRAPFGRLGRRSIMGPALKHYLHDLGDDLTGLFNNDRIANPHIQPGHLVIIVQRGVAHRRSRQLNRIEMSGRRDDACASYV